MPPRSLIYGFGAPLGIHIHIAGQLRVSSPLLVARRTQATDIPFTHPDGRYSPLHPFPRRDHSPPPSPYPTPGLMLPLGRPSYLSTVPVGEQRLGSTLLPETPRILVCKPLALSKFAWSVHRRRRARSMGVGASRFHRGRV